MRENSRIYSQSSVVTPEMLKKIEQYSLRPLSAQEIYVFSIILCDNDIDRDYERFDKQSLEELARLFLGKTGLFDHDPKSQNQTARIFDCQVLRDKEKRCGDGQEYYYLKASAYTVRSRQNEDLILDIDAGIKKEVSIGCCVEQNICSICGAQVKDTPCNHEKGQTYQGKLCYHLLQHPTDAYEWSFVAVPAQRKAGVTKQYQGWGQRDVKSLCKSMGAGQEIYLSSWEARQLNSYMTGLQKDANLGGQYRDELIARVRSLALLCGESSATGAFLPWLNRMEVEELKAFIGELEARLGYAPAPQTGPEQQENRQNPHGEFQI